MTLLNQIRATKSLPHAAYLKFPLILLAVCFPKFALLLLLSVQHFTLMPCRISFLSSSSCVEFLFKVSMGLLDTQVPVGASDDCQLQYNMVVPSHKSPKHLNGCL